MRKTLQPLWAIPALFALPAPIGHAQDAPPAKETPDIRTRPARIRSCELAGFAELDEARRKLVETALRVAWESPWLPYVAAGSDPAHGGFDCSGATYFVMRKAGLDPTRSAAAQLEWLRKHDKLHTVAADATSPDHLSLASLKPGDLLFWAVNEPDGRIRVHHVAIYLGTEKKDGRPVMIGSTDGRSYRGQKANGYGVHDFRLPKADSPSKLVGYGTPPGLGAE